jgi:hypothetical protein
MKRNKVMVSAAIVGLLFAGISAEAGFGIKVPAVSGGGGGDISGLKSNLTKMTGDVTKQCSLARSLFKESYAELALALDLKEESNKLRSEAKSLKSGNTSVSDLKKKKVISQETEALIQKKLKEVKDPTPEQKKHFWNAVNLLTKGLATETAQIHIAVQLGEKAKEITEKASGLDKAAAVAVAKPALDLALIVPADVKQATAVLATLTKYASERGLKAPTGDKADDLI